MVFINDYFDQYPNKNIFEIQKILLEKGISQRHIRVKQNCKVCGCEVIVTPCVCRKQKTFACEKHIKHRPSGSESKFYNRIKTNCSYCGKEIYLTPFCMNSHRSTNDNHFCSRQCYADYRSMKYCGENSSMYNHKYTQEQRKNLSKGAAKRAKNSNRLNSDIQLMINSLLDEMDIKYEREYNLSFYSCDNYLVDYDLIIEVMGDYWHANPMIYNQNGRKINQIQNKTVIKDKQKKSYIDNHYSTYILYLWESDIKCNKDKCKQLIRLFIESKGILPNYHSFNFSYNKSLRLNKNIIIPYQDIPIDKYKNLLK